SSVDEWIRTKFFRVCLTSCAITETAEELDPDLTADCSLVACGQYPDHLTDLGVPLSEERDPDTRIYEDHLRFCRMLFTRRWECGVLWSNRSSSRARRFRSATYSSSELTMASLYPL